VLSRWEWGEVGATEVGGKDPRVAQRHVAEVGACGVGARKHAAMGLEEVGTAQEQDDLPFRAPSKPRAAVAVRVPASA
jgi:hypothetical protein